MSKQQDRIYIQKWLDIKPYVKQVPEDSYYLKLCNKVKQAIVNEEISDVLLDYIEKDQIDTLSCLLTSYFEDLISGTNIWNTFVKCHYKLYYKPLPFYGIEDYIENEINLEDVHFLIWYFINTLQEEKFILSYNDWILELATKVMEVFDSEWEYAPENKMLKRYYSIDEKEPDYYVARNLIDTILFKTYLFYPDTTIELYESDIEIAENLKEEEDIENLLLYLNYNRDTSLYTKRTRLLGFKGQEWAAEILGKDHPLHDDYLNISKKITGYFLYTGQNNQYVFIEHIASGRKFNLVKESFEEQLKTLTQKNTILFMGIVRWQNEWWFSGISAQQPYDATLVAEERNLIESKMAINFLDYEQYKVEDVIEKQFAAFKDYTNGFQIVFLESSKIKAYLKGYTEHYNTYLKLSKNELKKAKERSNKEGFKREGFESMDFTDRAESGLVFFNPKSGVEVALNVNSAFPSPENPFFDIEESKEAIMHLFMSEDISTELAMYCVDNYKDKLPFFTEDDGRIFLHDIDFLLRFWKKNNYFTVPAITFTGKQKD